MVSSHRDKTGNVPDAAREPSSDAARGTSGDARGAAHPTLATPRPLSVLVIPGDPVIGRLLGTLVELAGHRVVLNHADESPEGALARTPWDVVMVDCDHRCAQSDSFAAAVRARGATIMLYSGAHSERETQYLAAARGLASFTLPNGPRRLAESLAEARGQR